MGFYEFFGFITILSTSIKLLFRNVKLMGLIVAFSIVLTSSFFLLFSYSFQSLVIDMHVNYKRAFVPNSSSYKPKPVQIMDQLGHLREDLALLLIVQIAYFFGVSIISVFCTPAMILVSSMSYSAKTISLKDLFTRIGNCFPRLMITTFYVSGLSIGYSVFVVMLVVPIMVYPNNVTLCVAILLWIVAFFVDLYLLVGWRLAIVVSVVEESCRGAEALAKAERLVKGKRLHGFLINICFKLLFLVLIIPEVCKMLVGGKGFVNPRLSSLFLVNVTFMLKIFTMVPYTVLYFQCKKHHGEETEIPLWYAKLPMTEMI